MRALLLESSICKKPSASQSTSTACYSSRKRISWIAKEPWNTEKEGTLWRQVPLYVRPLHRPTVFHWAINLNQVSLGPLLLPHRLFLRLPEVSSFPHTIFPTSVLKKRRVYISGGEILLALLVGPGITFDSPHVRECIFRNPIKIFARKIRNPTNWNPEYSTWNPESY